MKAINVKIEYLDEPIGIDVKKPRVFWNCEGGRKQTAYQILCMDGTKRLWDSGKVKSPSMRAELDVPYLSRLHAEVSVTLWDEDGEKGETTKTSFEYGLLSGSDWKAKWIAGNYRINQKKRYPVDCFSKGFTTLGVVKARLYISACGLYEAKLNDRRVGKFILAPGSTDDRRRIQYQTYDVTTLIQNGNNVLSVELADGWYRGSSGAKGRTNTYGTQTKLIAQLEITGRDGQTTTLCTDEHWAWSNDGPIEFADQKDGETVNANQTPSYSGVAKVVKYSANLTASNNVEVKEHEHFKPVERLITPSGKTVLKFPQNLCGYVAFKLQARQGDKIHIVLGEMLGSDGELSLKNIQCVHHGKPTPLQEFTYVCREGLNEYRPKYFYGGFQYALIETDIPFEDDDFTQIALYSDVKETSAFECSNELVNKFYRSTLWSLKSNSIDLPSDCPTRERMGWTGDSQVFFNSASYLTDYAAFARKHVRDIYDRQWKNGKLPHIAPFANEDWFMWVMNGSIGWACAGVYIPWRSYEKYGDKRILEENYEGMLHYAKFMISRQGKWGGVYSKPMGLSRENRKYAVNAGQSYGEWAEPQDVKAISWLDFAAPHPEESTAYTYYTLQKVIEVAKILGKNEDIPLLTQHSEGAKRAYQELVSKPKFSLDTDRQAKLVRPLYMGLLNEQQREFARKRLIMALDRYGWRLGTGFLSTPFILYVLGEIDIEYAYRLLENEEIPGWLSMPKNGGNSIWEGWEGPLSQKGIGSLNHYSKGAVCEWLFDGMCGIRVEGENHFVIAPRPGGSFTYAKAQYQSIYGNVSCGWEKKDGKTGYVLEIPSNCTAEIRLPDGTKKTVESGKYTF